MPIIKKILTIILFFLFFALTIQTVKAACDPECPLTCPCGTTVECLTKACTYTPKICPECSCVPDCSCARTTCIGDTCSNGCGGTCYGLKDGCTSCSNACPSECYSTCIGLYCGKNACGDSCYGTITCTSGCTSNADCVSGYTCTSGTCVAPPLPTTITNCSSNLSNCTRDLDCQNSSNPTFGDTCIITKEPTVCYCTTIGNKSDTSIWTCEVYRDAYYANGVCYNQWKCSRTDSVDPTKTIYEYEIRQTCIGGTEAPAPSGSSASCTVSLSPTAGTVEVGNTIGIEAVVSALNGTVDRVDFGMSEAGIFSLSSLSDSSSLYQTTATGLSVGTISIGASVVMGGSITCSTQPSIFSVVIPGPWWQVKDADVTSGGQIYSYIPMACSLPVCNPYFGLEGKGGFPGVPVSVGDAFFGEGDASEVGWVVNSRNASRKGYSYSLFERQIPSSAETTTVPVGSSLATLLSSGGVEDNGVYWYMYDGLESGLDLELGSDLDVGSRKVVLFVNNADFVIKGKDDQKNNFPLI